MIGEKIKELRLLKNLTQEEFGKIFNVTGATVSRWESEKMYPDYILLVMIKKHFNVTMDYLFGFED